VSCIYVCNSTQGAHVTINARNEDDVDEQVILEKVTKASGEQYKPIEDNVINSCFTLLAKSANIYIYII
jgi:hypothetical protein